MKQIIEELARIAQAVSKSHTPAEQVGIIVDSIARFMAVDVCSLYIEDENKDMQLVASHGLDRKAVGNVRLPAGQGLIGLVSTSGHPVNILDPKSHPAYVYLADTHEEVLNSFCGVPLLRAGEVIGVLTVQSKQAKQLNANEEAFLVALAAQVVLLATSSSIPAFVAADTNLRQTGIKAAPGIAIGQVQLCESGGLFSVVDNVCPDIGASIADWQRILGLVRQEIQAEAQLIGDQGSENVQGIFSAYEMLLTDQALVDAVETRIREGIWLPGALRAVIQDNANLFLAMDDPYLRARHEDIVHLGNKLYQSWKGTAYRKDYGDQSIILAGPQVSVSDIARIPINNLAGVVCYEGSSFSHTSILANALGIPAVMGIGGQVNIHNDDMLVVDGTQGEVMLRPDPSIQTEYQELIEQQRYRDQQLAHLRDLPARTQDDRDIELLVNTGLLSDISPGLDHGAQGVGLYRTEIPFMVNQQLPDEAAQETAYRQVLTAYTGKPVYMRTLDVGGDKQLPYLLARLARRRSPPWIRQRCQRNLHDHGVDATGGLSNWRCPGGFFRLAHRRPEPARRQQTHFEH